MRKNKDDNTRARRKRIWRSTLISSIWPLTTTVFLVVLRYLLEAEGILSIALLTLALLNMCMLIPAWINLIRQLREE